MSHTYRRHNKYTMRGENKMPEPYLHIPCIIGCCATLLYSCLFNNVDILGWIGLAKAYLHHTPTAAFNVSHFQFLDTLYIMHHEWIKTISKDPQGCICPSIIFSDSVRTPETCVEVHVIVAGSWPLWESHSGKVSLQTLTSWPISDAAASDKKQCLVCGFCLFHT